MRGKVEELTDEEFGQWITPAYAGKRKQLRFAAGAVGDHPRVCGEKRRKT